MPKKKTYTVCKYPSGKHFAPKPDADGGVKLVELKAGDKIELDPESATTKAMLKAGRIKLAKGG